MPPRSKPQDVLIIGAGIMGTSVALELSRRGASVTVLEKSLPGAEASSAAAGMLAAEAEAEREGPMLELCRYSRDLYRKWVKDLELSTQVSVGYLEGGSLEIAFSPAELSALKKKRKFQLESGRAELLSKTALAQELPEVSPHQVGGVFLGDDARISPPELFVATRIAAEAKGVRFVSGHTVRRVTTRAEKSARHVDAVVLEDGSSLRAETVVVAAGSWTPLIEGLPLTQTDIIPARGQIVQLEMPQPIAECVLFGAGCYLIPRANGQVLIGSTLEFVGFQKGVTAKGVRDLLTSATTLLPCLEGATVSGMWSSFRPYTKDHLPLLGETSIRGLLMASGHYRTGILLAPATAKIIADLAQKKRPRVDLSAFDPLRGQG